MAITQLVHAGRDSGVEIKQANGGIFTLTGFAVILSHFFSHNIASGKVLWESSMSSATAISGYTTMESEDTGQQVIQIISYS